MSPHARYPRVPAGQAAAPPSYSQSALTGAERPQTKNALHRCVQRRFGHVQQSVTLCTVACQTSPSERGSSVRKHLTRGFLCADLDLSGILWPIAIPEYSGIKRRGTPFPGAEESRHFSLQ